MKPTIAWIEASAGNPRHQRLWDLVEETANEISGGRAEILFSHLAFSSGGIRTAPGRLLNDAAVLQRAVEVAPATDAVVIGCWGAPTDVVRAAVSAPVTSVAEGTVRAVSSLARRAVMVTVAPSLVQSFASNLTQMQASGFHQAQPVIAYAPESTHDELVAAIDDPGRIIDRFDDAARVAVESGADAIVVGCAYLSAIFRLHGYSTVMGHPDVQILDCNQLAIEHALMLYELDRAGIRASTKGFARPAGRSADLLVEGLGRMA